VFKKTTVQRRQASYDKREFKGKAIVRKIKGSIRYKLTGNEIKVFRRSKTFSFKGKS